MLGMGSHPAVRQQGFHGGGVAVVLALLGIVMALYLILVSL